MALGVTAFLFVAIVVAYAGHLRHSARDLMISARQIHSTADAEREITMWRGRVPRGYTESRSPDGKGLACQIQLNNSLLSRLHLVPNSGILLQITLYSGQLSDVLIGVYTETSSVWVQEDFSGKGLEKLFVNSERDGSGKPLKTTVMLTSNVGSGERQNAFALDSTCLVKLGGCPHADEILPTLPLLQNSARTPSTGGVAKRADRSL